MKYTVKRAMSLTLLTAILMSVVSCGSEGTPADDTDQSTTTTTTAETTLVKEPDFPDVTFDNE